MTHRLRSYVVSPQHHATFERARTRQPELAHYTCMTTVLATLTDDEPNSYPVREALTRALLAEHHTSETGDVWAAALLVAYFPMLSRLRHSLIGHSLPREELDQLVLTSFVEVISHHTSKCARSHVAFHLRRCTERRVFHALRAELKAGLIPTEFIEEPPEPDLADQEFVNEGARTSAATRLFTGARIARVPTLRLSILTEAMQHERLRAYVPLQAGTDRALEERGCISA